MTSLRSLSAQVSEFFPSLSQHQRGLILERRLRKGLSHGSSLLHISFPSISLVDTGPRRNRFSPRGDLDPEVEAHMIFPSDRLASRCSSLFLRTPCLNLLVLEIT